MLAVHHIHLWHISFVSWSKQIRKHEIQILNHFLNDRIDVGLAILLSTYHENKRKYGLPIFSHSIERIQEKRAYRCQRQGRIHGKENIFGKHFVRLMYAVWAYLRHVNEDEHVNGISMRSLTHSYISISGLAFKDVSKCFTNTICDICCFEGIFLFTLNYSKHIQLCRIQYRLSGQSVFNGVIHWLWQAH